MEDYEYSSSTESFPLFRTSYRLICTTINATLFSLPPPLLGSLCIDISLPNGLLTLIRNGNPTFGNKVVRSSVQLARWLRAGGHEMVDGGKLSACMQRATPVFCVCSWLECTITAWILPCSTWAIVLQQEQVRYGKLPRMLTWDKSWKAFSCGSLRNHTTGLGTYNSRINGKKEKWARTYTCVVLNELSLGIFILRTPYGLKPDQLQLVNGKVTTHVIIQTPPHSHADIVYELRCDVVWMWELSRVVTCRPVLVVLVVLVVLNLPRRWCHCSTHLRFERLALPSLYYLNQRMKNHIIVQHEVYALGSQQ